jgi:hypothetical protein
VVEAKVFVVFHKARSHSTYITLIFFGRCARFSKFYKFPMQLKKYPSPLPPNPIRLERAYWKQCLSHLPNHRSREPCTRDMTAHIIFSPPSMFFFSLRHFFSRKNKKTHNPPPLLSHVTHHTSISAGARRGSQSCTCSSRSRSTRSSRPRSTTWTRRPPAAPAPRAANPRPSCPRCPVTPA